LLKDAFDQEFLAKLKQEISQGNPNFSKTEMIGKKRLFSKFKVGQSTNTNIRTSTNTPNIHTPIRSPNQNEEFKESKILQKFG
jgi:hypothetical protein